MNDNEKKNVKINNDDFFKAIARFIIFIMISGFLAIVVIYIV